MKRGLFVILIIVLMINLLSCAEDVKFDPKKGETWKSGTEEDLKKITSEDMISNPDYIEASWDGFLETEKEKYLISEIKKTTGKTIKSLNIGSKYLTLKEGVLFDKNGAKFNLKDFPKTLVSLTYDKDKGFIYGFEKGSVTLDKGYLDKDNKLQGIDKTIDGRLVYESGNLVYKQFVLNFDSNSKVKLDGYVFTKGNLEGESYLKFGRGVGVYAAKNIRAYSEKNFIVDVKSKETLLVFSNGDVSKLKQPFVKIFEDSITFSGDGNFVHTLKNFNSISHVNPNEKSLVYIGESDKFPIEFDKDKINLLRGGMSDAPFTVKDIMSQGVDLVYSLNENEDSSKFFTDRQKLVSVGSAYFSYVGNLQEGKNPLSLLGVSLDAGKIDLSKIPEGLSEKEFFEALSKSNALSFGGEFFHPISQYNLEFAVAKSVRQAVGEDYIKKIQEGVRLASRYSLLDLPEKTTPESYTNQKIVDAAKLVYGKLNEVVEQIPEATYRQLEERPVLRATEAIIPRLAPFVLSQDQAQLVPSVSGMADTADMYTKFSRNLQKVYETYNNQIPKGMKFELEVRGEQAYGRIVPPTTQVKYGEEFKVVSMSPIEFPIGKTATRKIILSTLRDTQLGNKLYEEYKSSRK